MAVLRVMAIRCLSAVLVVLGLTVVFGWLLGIAALTSLLPGLTSMVFDTALCLSLCGCALWFNIGSPRQQRGLWLPATAVLLIAALNALNLGFGLSTGIEVAALHRWNHDGNPRPGQMAGITAIAFLLAATGLLLLRARAGRRWPALAIQALALTLFVIGAAAIVGYALHVELLYGWYEFGRMAPHTAIGLILVSATLWLSLGRVGPGLVQERQLTALGVLSLIAVAAVSGLTGIAVFRIEGETALGNSLHVTREARIEQLRSTLQQQTSRAAIITTRVELIRLLRQNASSPGDVAALHGAQDLIDSFRPHGFSRLELLSATGRPLAASGSPVAGAAMAVALGNAASGEENLLLWQDGFVLRSRLRIGDATDPVGTLIAEQPLPALSQALTSADQLGSSAEILLCAPRSEGALCFPDRQHPQPFAIAAADGSLAELLAGAARGEQGVDSIRLGTASNLVAYGPVGTTGLISALRIDAAELFAPIRRGLFWGLLLIGTVTASAALLLRALIRPLVRELAVAEGYNHAVLESLSESFLLFDSTGTVLAANSTAERHFGVSRAVLLGRTIRDNWNIMREDGSVWPQSEYPAAIALRTGLPVYRHVLGIPRPDGEQRWYSVSCVPTATLPGGQDRGVVVSVTDITEQRRAEALSRQLEQRFRLLIESITDYGILMLDASGRIESWNPAAERIEGYRADEIIGSHFCRSYLPEDRAAGKPERALKTAAETGRYADEGWRLRKDSTRYWAGVVISAVRDERGRLVGYAKVSHDLTAQRQAEESLRRSEEQYRMLVGGIADGVVSIDEQGIVRSFNSAAERIFGLPAAAVTGRSVTMLMPERFRADAADNVARFALQQDPAIIGLRRDVTGLRADGREFPMTLALNVMPGSDPVRFVALVTDITERQLAEQRLAEAHSFQRAVLESAPYAVIACGTDFRCTVFNPAAERMLCYDAADVLGKVVPTMIHDPRELALRAEELGKELGCPIEPGPEVLVSQARRGIAEEREWTYIRQNGSRFPVNVAVTEMRDDEGRVTGYVSVAYDITDRKRREDYTHHIAHHDFLTGLPNRMLLNHRLDLAIGRARRAQERVAVLMLDLDHFKRVNDSLGHHVGDELLKQVAERIKGCIRGVDTVARMGGDEFVVVLGQMTNPGDVERIAADIVERIGAPIRIGTQELVVTSSIGISCFPLDGDDAHLLLRNADSAMYRAKAAGRGGYRRFNAEMSRDAQQRLEMEGAIRRALLHDEFHLHYQPQICLDSGEVTGMEALLRWNDPVRGAVAPDEFIGIAEDCGLIDPLGEWVLHTACRDAVQLQRRTGTPLRLAVNLSARQFRQGHLVPTVRKALDQSGLAADCLELEITEGVLMLDSAETIGRLRELRSLGVTIAIDDFGIGFSSLSYITRFPIDTLKIDRSFVRQLPDSRNDAAVAQAIIALGRSLGITVIAEGVETRAQLEFLRARHCDAAQGFYFGRPVPAHGFGVQGFCFGRAVSADAFVADFEDLRARGRHALPKPA